MKYFFTIVLLSFCLTMVGQAMPVERTLRVQHAVTKADVVHDHHLSMVEGVEDVQELDQEVPPVEAVDNLIGILPVEPSVTSLVDVPYRILGERPPLYITVQRFLI